jgi:putative endonuclease
MDPNQGIEFEKKIKKWSREKKQSLIDENFDKLQELSEYRNATHHKYNLNNDLDFEKE